jgi:hypothetical protein
MRRPFPAFAEMVKAGRKARGSADPQPLRSVRPTAAVMLGLASRCG